jgi:hypothetical protein
MARYPHVLAVILLAGCDGPGGQTAANLPPLAGAQTVANAAPVGHPVAHPTSLFFRSRRPLKFTVRQIGYDGGFVMMDSGCGGIASVSPKSANGPMATFTVTPIASPSGGGCVVSVADAVLGSSPASALGYSATVSVGNPGY